MSAYRCFHLSCADCYWDRKQHLQIDLETVCKVNILEVSLGGDLFSIVWELCRWSLILVNSLFQNCLGNIDQANTPQLNYPNQFEKPVRDYNL